MYMSNEVDEGKEPNGAEKGYAKYRAVRKARTFHRKGQPPYALVLKFKQNYGFRRFLRRGYANVFTGTLLYAIAFNLNKLHARVLANNCGYTLYQLNSA